MGYEMGVRRGEIHYIADKGATVGSEQRAGRPALVVSNNACNEHSPTIEVVYLTSQPKKPLPTHVQIMSTSNGKAEGSTILCEQICTISKSRLQVPESYMARLTDEDMDEVDRALMVSLGLDVNRLYYEQDDEYEDDSAEDIEEEPQCYETGIEVPPEAIAMKQMDEDMRQAKVEAEFYKKQYEALLERILQKAKM